jgi:hypothetical protein
MRAVLIFQAHRGDPLRMELGLTSPEGDRVGRPPEEKLGFRFKKYRE